MNPLTTWILIACSVSGYASNPVVIEKFSLQQDCLSSATTLESLSADKRGMTSIKAICLPVKNTKE